MSSFPGKNGAIKTAGGNLSFFRAAGDLDLLQRGPECRVPGFVPGARWERVAPL